MKNSAWDNKLWQIKMQELPLEGDGDAAWGKMQGLLDETMPVAPGSGSGGVRKLWGLPRSLVLTVVCTAAAAAILIFATHYVLNKRPAKENRPHKENIKEIRTRADSNKTDSSTDTLKNNLPPANPVKADSLNTGKPSPASRIRNEDIKPDSQKSAGINNKTSSSRQRQILAQSGRTGSTLAANLKNTGATNSYVKPSNVRGQHQNLLLQNHRHNKSSVTAHYSAGGKSTSSFTVSHHLPAAFSNNPQNKPASRTGSAAADKGLGANTPSQTAKANPSTSQATSKNNDNVIAAQSKKPDSSKTISNKTSNLIAAQPAPGNPSLSTSKVVNKAAAKPASPKTKSPKTQSYSKFELGLEAGINSGKSSTTPFVGLSGFYAVDPKFSISIGGNIFSSRTITGKYNIGKYQYTTQNDSNIIIASHTAKNLVVTTSQKLYTVEIPLMASYKLTKWLSIKGGPVLSIPIKTGSVNNTLAPVGSPLDTASAFKTLSSAVNSTTILNKATLNITGGVLININKVYFDASYVQGTGPYTIHSSLGSGNVYYHYLQLGVGYKLFQSKSKPKPNHN